jgi:hypothetical protein
MKLTDRVQLYAEPTNILSESNADVEMVKSRITVFRAFKAETIVYESPVKKMNVHKITSRPNFETYLKEIAACLSNIEMALDCYDLSGLQLSTRVLKELFHDMKMLVIYRLAVQMEVMASDNQVDEVKDLFREIKKTIGAEVQRRNRGQE